MVLPKGIHIYNIYIYMCTIYKYISKYRYIYILMYICVSRTRVGYMRRLRAGVLFIVAKQKTPKEKDPTNNDFWYPAYTGPWNQSVGSFCFCGLFGPLFLGSL